MGCPDGTMGKSVCGAIGLSSAILILRPKSTAPGAWSHVVTRQLANLPSPIGQMAKKTTDKKDAGKKSNAGKDADDPKVRCLISVGSISV